MCGLILATPGAVRRHTKIHDKPEVQEELSDDDDDESESEDEEEFVGVACSEAGCDRMFKTETAMKYHARVKHWGGPPDSLECPDCHKVFTQRAHLKVRYAHIVLGPFKLNFSSSINLIAVLVSTSHTGLNEVLRSELCVPGRFTGGYTKEFAAMVQQLSRYKKARMVKMSLACRAQISTEFKLAEKVEIKTVIGSFEHEK